MRKAGHSAAYVLGLWTTLMDVPTLAVLVGYRHLLAGVPEAATGTI